MTGELEISTLSTTFATSPLYVNFDVNEFLLGHTEAELWDMLGKLKDFFEPSHTDG